MQAPSHRTFFQRYAILILMAAFFLLPFALRGARLSVRGMRNDVKDWLPSEFKETTELKWFRDHFSSEAFVMASWEGCRGTLDDDHFRLFVDKFFSETPPSQRREGETRADDDQPRVNEALNLYVRQKPPYAARDDEDFVGNAFGLYVPAGNHKNWGGQDEKWLRGNGGQWYYVLPNGDLYKWEGMDSWVGRAGRMIRRWVIGENKLVGQRVHVADPEDGPWYYNDPRRMEADLFKSVLTGPAVVHMLTREGGALEGDRQAAVDRLRGTLFAEQGENTCVLLTLTDHGRNNLHQALGRGVLGRPRGRLLRIAEEAGLRPPAPPSLWPPPFDRWFDDPVQASGPIFRMGGPPVDNVAIDEEGQATLARLVGLSVLLGIVISWFSFRSLPVTMLLLFVGLASAVASLAFVWWSGSTMDAVLMSMPSLVYVLGLSAGVHLVNYYRDTVAVDGFPGNPTSALRVGWKPCFLAAFTTALGLVSLANADIVPISKFGIYSAVAVIFTLAAVFTVIPAGLQLWPPANFAKIARHQEGAAQHGVHGLIHATWQGVGRFVIRRHLLVTCVCIVVLALGVLGARRINTTVQLLKLFHPESKIIQDYTWLETHLGKLVPMELVARVEPTIIRRGELHDGDGSATAPTAFDPEDRFRLSFLDRMEITDHIRAALDERFEDDPRQVVGSSMMAATFVPPRPRSGGAIAQIGVRGAYSRQLTGYRDEILQSDYFRLEHDTESELWRVSLRLAALTNVDYGNFVTDIKTAVEPVMAAYKYRQYILHAVDRKRDGEGFRGARVLVLGVDRGAVVENTEADAESGAAPVDNPSAPIATSPRRDGSFDHQWQIFSGVMDDLLTNAALKVTWHDPRSPLRDDWTARLDRFDCIVLVRDDPRYAALKERPELAVVDATNFAYIPGRDDVTAWEEGQPVSVVYTGLVPVVYKAQRTLLNNLISSTFWAFVTIAVVMMLLLRRPTAGLISMLPNVFPLIIVFGAMGWSGVLVDIGSMMTASVAMGIAVDDTIHFLTWFRRGLDDGKGRHDAIEQAYTRCATAMTQSTLIAGLGLSVFGLSTFTPTQRFGVLMLTLLFAALAGDLIFLPALLAGPGGRVFEPRVKKNRGRTQQPPLPQSDPAAAAHSEGVRPGVPDETIAKRTPHATPQIRRDGSHL